MSLSTIKLASEYGIVNRHDGFFRCTRTFGVLFTSGIDSATSISRQWS